MSTQFWYTAGLLALAAFISYAVVFFNPRLRVIPAVLAVGALVFALLGVWA